jgi:hypothetical protein
MRKDDQAIDAQEAAARGKLPVCPGEAGEPSSLALRNVARAYVPKHAAVAQTYLAKFAPLIQQMRQTVAPEVSHGDAVFATWNRLENPDLKQRVAASASAAVGNAYTDVTQLAGFVSAPSRQAAQVIANKDAIERLYANASGC